MGIKTANSRAKGAARKRVHRAVKNGDLVRPSVCSQCGQESSQIIAHHHNGYDYDHALDVVWLCAGCHAKIHADGKASAPPAGSNAVRIVEIVAELRLRHGWEMLDGESTLDLLDELHAIACAYLGMEVD